MITHDITAQFHSATRHVTAGTLVKDDHFSLFEAVGALEIGDPKMDSGCLEPGESLDQEFDVTKDILPEELIWLMDGLLNREEEDFTTQLFNRELLHKFAGESISQIAFEALIAVGESQINPQLKDAISARLGFRHEVLGMLMKHTNSEAPPSSHTTTMHQSLDAQQKSQPLSKPVSEAFSTKLQRRLASTVPPRPMVTVSMDQAWNFWHQMLDDCSNIFSVRQATHSQDLYIAYQIFAYSSPQPSTYPRALLQMFLTNENLVGSRIEPSYFLEEDIRSLTLPASQLLRVANGTYGRFCHGNQRVADTMQEFIDRFEHNFVNLYRALCLNSCRMRRTFCHALLEWDNLQAQVEELDAIIQEAVHEQPTPYLPGSPPTFSFSLSSWIYHHKLNVLQLTIQMGFELAIYAPHELAGMYWYLSSICDIHLSHLERISHFVTAKDTEVKRSKMTPAVKEKAIKECKDALDRLYKQYAWIKATQLLAGTMHGIFVVLQRYGVFVNQQPLYSSDMMRYEIRMKPFLGLSIPEPLSHDDSEREVQMQNIDTEEILDQVTGFSADAKKAWEEVSKTTWNMFPITNDVNHASVLTERRTADLKDCLKAAIAASLCVLSLKKVLKNDAWKEKAQKEARLPAPGVKGRWHRWWILPALPPV
ncbi:N-alpha-acetyltransferase, non-catalitic subunit [Lithohypha guttulata]|uniref:N-alpha-acetyltransferase, non-catalitic subunit n=1 Tax=Lithohypha guttulata TaxID=1690604 RepID=A0AAN7T2K8_9EURO|nr:N-alpha-acetyltransferase, non-catalitic subunit [Lithohypha guttulata]